MSILRQEGPYPWHHDHNNQITTLKEYNPMSGTPIGQEAAKAINPTSKKSRLESEIDDLNVAISGVDIAVKHLWDKVQPIMGPSDPSPATVEEDWPEMSAAARMMREMTARLLEIRTAVDTMYNRLEC